MDAEKDAMEWLDRAMTYRESTMFEGYPDSDGPRAIIKSLLAEPRLPKVWSREQLMALRDQHLPGMTLGALSGVLNFVHHFLTKPKTKKVVRVRGNDLMGDPVDIVLDFPISQTEIEVPA